MARSSVTRVDKILELLNGIEIDNPVKDGTVMSSNARVALWAKHSDLMTLKLVKTFFCYIAERSSNDGRWQYLPTTTTFRIEAALDGVEADLSAHFSEANHQQHTIAYTSKAIWNCHLKIRDRLQRQVADAYCHSSTLSNHPIRDHLIFDEFVASVQAYLESLPLELESYLNIYPAYNWKVPFPRREVEECVTTIVHNLESLKHAICGLAKWCINEEKLQRSLALAGAFVFRITRQSCTFVTEPYREFSPRDVFLHFSILSKEVSPHNFQFRKIYREVLQEYVEIQKAGKSSRTFSSITAEDAVNSFLTFIVSTKNKVDSLSDALDFLFLLDPVRIPEDNKVLMKLYFAFLAVVSGSLDYSIGMNENPNEKFREKGFLVLSKLQHQIKLIKAEIFLLELHKQKATLMVPIADQVAAIRKAMGFLIEFFEIPERYLGEPEKSILTLIEAVVRKTRSLCHTYQDAEVTEYMILESSLAIFKLFKAEAMLLVLINNNSSMTFLGKYRIETLHKCLISLRALLSDPPTDNLEDRSLSTFVEAIANEAVSLVCSFGKCLIFLRALLSDPPTDNLEDRSLSTFVEAITNEAVSLVCSFGNTKTVKDQSLEMNLLLSHLPKKIEINNAEVKAIYQKPPWSSFSNFPKSNGFGFIDFLLEELRELLTYNPDTIAYMKDQVQELLQELEFLRCILKDVAEQLNENNNLGTRLLCLIYEAENIIDLFVVGDVPIWYHQLALLVAMEDAKLIKAQLLEFCHEKNRCDYAIQSDAMTSRHMALEANNQSIEEVIVGFDDQAEIIIEQLESGSQRRQIVSIVGMPGLGKTTLAKKVFSSRKIEYHFIVRAWCYVSQIYQKRELLLDILGDFVELTGSIQKMDDEGLAQTLYQNLKGRRYLIVMDDVWSIEPWNDLKILLPDDNNGSRILFTSRLRDVALQGNPTMDPHSLPLLSDEESWKLLQEKLFHGASCPEQLLEDGRLIAKNCMGLPLAVVVVAGLLRRTEMHKDWWNEVAKTLRPRVADDKEMHFMDVLGFSYSHLPAYLKPCFLYFGAFLENQEIPVQKLTRLWIAEGFVQNIGAKSQEESAQSQEETADDYLVDLIGRSLVMEAKRRSKGGTKTCRMHDMLRDLCLEKAREENFMQLIAMHGGGNSALDSVSYVHYRVCVHSSKDNFILSTPFGPHVHSLLFFATSSIGARHSYDISFIPHKFKLLRVLDLEYINIGADFPVGIELMFRLRYLSVKATIRSVPSSITKLWSLETLIVKGTKGDVVLPESIWSMARLRHLQVNNWAAFSLPVHGLQDPVMLNNLITLSSPVISYGKEIEKIMKRLSGLRKLRCIFLEHWDDYKKCNVFPTLDFLTQLESLKIFYYGGRSLPCEFSFPLNLKKLTLSKFRLSWEYISAIRKLPNLAVLKLLCQAFEGQTWDMPEGEFPNLKFLKLETLNIADWNASSDHFPKLERLVLQSCKNLKQVPYCFGEIYTLQMVEVHWCSPSAANSVGIVLEQQQDMGNDEFKVLINPPEWDFKTSS